MAVPKLVGINLKKVINVPEGLPLALLCADPAFRSLAFSTEVQTESAVIQVCLDWDNPSWKEYSHANGILGIPNVTEPYDLHGIDLKYPWLYVSGTDFTDGRLKRIDIRTDTGLGKAKTNYQFREIGISYTEPIQAYVAIWYQLSYYGPHFVPWDTMVSTPLQIGHANYWYEVHFSKVCNVVAFSRDAGDETADSTRVYFLKNPNGTTWEAIRRIRSTNVDPFGYPSEHLLNAAYDDLTDTCIVRYGFNGNEFALTKGFTAESLDQYGYAPVPVTLIQIPTDNKPYSDMHGFSIPVACYRGWLFVLGSTGVITAINLETYEQLEFRVLPNQSWRELRIYPGGVLIAGARLATAQIAIAQIEMRLGNRYLNLSKPPFFVAPGTVDKPGLDITFPRWVGRLR